MNKAPRLLIIAGPNGAGKTTFAIARVAERVRQGGHDVAELTIRRRFHAGIANFHTRYAPLVDAWVLYDNSLTPPVLLDWSERT